MSSEKILIPDIGDFDSVDVIEVLVNIGDTIEYDMPLITVESDKASMDIPAPKDGVIKDLKIKVGDKVKEGSLIGLIEVTETKKEVKTEIKSAPEVEKKEDIEKITHTPSRPAPEPPEKKAAKEIPIPIGESVLNVDTRKSHAGPSVRKFARNLGVNLSFVEGSGNKNRILIEDVESYVKGELTKPRTENMGASFAPIPMPNIDFTEFGKIETKPLSKIKKISGANLHRNWVTAPHVTQFDECRYH